MVRIRVVGAGLVAGIAVALALSGARAQTATSEQAGKPLALLAGLRPPHETKAQTKADETKARVHAKAAHRSVERTAARKTHRKFARKVAAGRTRHVALQRHKHRERSIAAAISAPAQAAPNAPPANDRPVADAPTAVAVSPAPETAAANDNADPGAMVGNGQTVQVDTSDQVNSPDQVNSLDLAAPVAAAAADDRADAAAAPETVLTAPVHRDAAAVGSASWIAQVLAACGGAVAAGAVAWFLIGGGPVRTYG